MKDLLSISHKCFLTCIVFSEHMKVGQNIATITGPSAGFNVKSFVEIWFMQSLVYDGSVTYYNE